MFGLGWTVHAVPSQCAMRVCLGVSLSMKVPTAQALAAEVAATVYQALGIDPRTRLPAAGGAALPLVDANPVGELF